MDGYIANLPEICDLADKYDASGDGRRFARQSASWAPRGRGTHEYHGVMDRVDILTGTLGKALGGERRLHQWSQGDHRTAPPAFAALSVLQFAGPPDCRHVDCHAGHADAVDGVTRPPGREYAVLSAAIAKSGFTVLPGEHPIVPIMLGDAALAGKMADALLAKGIYVIGFSYPVVPQGQARIRTQISAAHSREDLEFAVAHFAKSKQSLGL